MHSRLLYILTPVIFPFWLHSQCDPITPTFTVDLTGNPSGSWLSPNTVRDGQCCGQSPRCVKFIITLDPAAAGISFTIASGANPGGALAYQVNCDLPPSPLGSPICLSGVGPHIITFCKPGNNSNTYQITSVPKAVAGTDVVINDGCYKVLSATGFKPATVTWNSIFPGVPGAYNNYLSCTSGCLSSTAIAIGSPPPYVDYVVCGQPASNCNFITVCDTIRVTFNPTLLVNILPVNPTICFGQTSTTLTAIGIGGTPPYSYLWNNVNPSQTINVGVGTYNVQLSDGSGCPPVFNQVTVTAFSVSITSNAGPNQTKCNQIPLATLNGTVTGAGGGIWSGGTGTYSPNNTTLSNLSYSPTAAELASGSVDLILTTTGNGTCPLKRDTVKITYVGFTGVVTPSLTNVSCFGGNNGSGTVSLSGGFTPYTYFWNTVPTQTTSTAGNLQIGTYSVTIWDGLGCTYPTTINIIQPPILSINSIIENVSCSGGSTGSILALPVGGTAPYSYTWSPVGLTTPSITGLPIGNYSLTVKDANNCFKTATYTITQSLPIALTFTQINVSCFNDNDGTIATTVIGGTSPYIFSWAPGGATSQNVTGLQAGTYTLTVTDNFSCTATNTIAVTQPTLLLASTIVTNETCNYLNNGSATASQTGGSSGYSYLWQPGGQVSASIANQASGIYTVVVTDSKGCQATAIATITEPAPLTADFINQIDVSCFGGSNGSIGVSPSGGTPNYTYIWTPGNATTDAVFNISTGIYSVTITDNNNCIVQNTIAIAQQTAALNVSTSSIPTLCNGVSDGSASALASGGTPTYTYSWMPGAVSGQNFSNISSGIYTVTVTDIKGCITTNTVLVNQPAPILPVTTSTNSTCGNANGIGSVSATGGIGSYTYFWQPSGGTNSLATNLLSGAYTVIVTDANGCTGTQFLDVNDSGGPVANIFSLTDVSCNGGTDGTATVGVSGGVAPLTILWAPSGGNGLTASGLSAGTYNVSITDSNGCQAVVTTSPDISEPPPISENIITSNVSCFGGSNGSTTVTAGGGTPGYTYSWLPGATTSSVVTGLTSGTYSVQITDANNCVYTTTYSITQPTTALTASANFTAVSCFGGNNGIATANAIGGTSPYYYNWLPISLNNQTIGGLSTGVYTVNVFDFKNCTTSTTVMVTQPTQSLSATANSVPTSCSGGSDGTATVTPTGGTGSFSYSWSPIGGISQNASGLTQGAYIINVTDANSCQTNVSVIISSPTIVTGSLTSVNSACGLANGSISSQVSGGIGPYTYSWSPILATTPNVNGLLPGNYTLQLKDLNGCIKTVTTTLINVPGSTLSLLNTLNDSCFGDNNGSATINISQGTLPYATNWFPFGGNSTTASQLTAGIYTANVTDGRDCLSSITVTITEPAPVSISINTIANVSCFNGDNGSIGVTAAGGTPTYSYSWSPSGAGQTTNNLTAGSYTVNVMDSHFCRSSISMNITQPTTLTSGISSINPLCFNGNGSSTTSVTGGTAPYTYSWTTNPQQNGSIASNIVSGTYTVLIKDWNGCTTSNSITLTQPTQVITNAGLNDTICFAQSGSVNASALGGSGNGYYYVWQPSGVINLGTLTINSSNATTNYTVVAFDQNGCAGSSDTVKAVVYNLTAGNIGAIALTPICPGQGTTIYANSIGNTGPLTYTWNNGLGNGPGAFVTTPLQPTTYVVTASNYCGSSIKDSVIVLFNPQPTLSVSPSTTLSCIPTLINFFDNSITGNVNDPITNWLWNFGNGNSSSNQNPSYIYTSPGTYLVSLTITTNGGCTNNNATAPIIVNAYPYPVASFSINAGVLNIPYDVLICTNQSSGATVYDWDFDDRNTSTAIDPHYNYVTVGEYQIQLVATSSFGCKDTAYADVRTDADIIFPNAFTPNNNGPSGGNYSLGSLDNDIFFPYSSGVTDFKFQIFNRWGELIFETYDIKQGWDGYYRSRLCQVGVYVWKAYVKLNNGKIFNKTGDVTLLR